jgi:hypothetical protein
LNIHPSTERPQQLDQLEALSKLVSLVKRQQSDAMLSGFEQVLAINRICILLLNAHSNWTSWKVIPTTDSCQYNIQLLIEAVQFYDGMASKDKSQKLLDLP